MAAPHSHRSGKLKQQNKKNKRSTASKRSVNRRAGGKIQLSKGTGGGVTSKAKADRINEAKQRREVKKRDLLAGRRGLIGGAGGSTELRRVADVASRPRVVGIISLSEEEGIEERVRDVLVDCSEGRVVSTSFEGGSEVKRSVTVHYGNKKSSPTSGNLTILTNTTSFRPQYTTHTEQDASIQSALDLCRICDLVLFVIDGRSVVTSHNDASTSGGMSVAATSIKTGANTSHLDHVVSERGDGILSAVKSQGLPTPVTLIVHGDVGGSVGDFVMDTEEDDMNTHDGMSLDFGVMSQHTSKSAKSIQRSYNRRRAELKRYVTRFACTEFGENNSKILEVDLGATCGGFVETSSSTQVSTNTVASKTQQTSVSALVRTLCTISASGPTWVLDAPRPYLITDGTANSKSTLFVSGGKEVGPPAVAYNPNNKELQLTGYIYGNTVPWNVNNLVHVPHLGTYSVKNIALAGVGEETLPPIKTVERKNRKGVEMQDATAGARILAESNVEEREPLDMFAAPDALDGEQNLIGFDEHDDEDLDEEAEKEKDNTDTFQPGTQRPAGWSDYQSAWLDAIDDTDDVVDHGELAFALNKKKGDANTVGDDAMDEDMEVNAEDRCALLAQRKKDQKDDLEFPDEVAVEEEGAARDRYARYRSLKSFRKSHWDPKENLPDSYGAVYHFSSFKATQRDVMADAKELNDIVGKRGFGCDLIGGTSEGSDDVKMDSDDEEDDAIARACVPTGAYVTITLEDVPPEAYSLLSPDTILTAVSLLPHENKVSVLHAGLSQSSKCEADKEVPVKSKDVLTFRCGWKTWQGRPIFSQNNLNSDKHKFERFMPVGGAFFACTMFGPVTYSPCPVLVFREVDESDGKRRELLAHGSMIGADADRIVLKRIILTGYPTRVHKRHATVKYMFYNPEDVKWFQPAGLSTKHGLQGNIIQSVGDHGVMKCLFNAPIKQHDTVCLPLYKRIFPKFAPEQDEGEDGKSCRMTSQLKVL